MQSSCPVPGVKQTFESYRMGALVQQAQTAEERERIYQFRYQVYVQEMGKSLPDPDHEKRVLKDECDAQAVHLYIEREGEIVGSLRMIWGGNGWPSLYPEWVWVGVVSAVPSGNNFIHWTLDGGKQIPKFAIRSFLGTRDVSHWMSHRCAF